MLDHDTLQLVATIAGAVSTAIVAVCTVLNNRYAAQHNAGAQENAALTLRVSNEVSALSDKVDTQAAPANNPPEAKT